MRTARVWVVPNRNTTGLIAVLIGMWWAGVSQSNGAAYLLGFVLTAVALISTVHAWANLRGVRLSVDTVRPVFAGEELRVPVRARSAVHRSHFGIGVTAGSGGERLLLPTISPTEEVSAEVRALAAERGAFAKLTLRISTRYPLGFFTAWSDLRIAAPHFVYPALAGHRPLPIEPTPARSARDGTRVEGDDFGGVRAWRAGESQRHIDWKAAARGQPLLVKQWTGEADQTAMLDWALLHDLATEARLSQLAQWVLTAEREGCRYGLRLPGRPEIAPNRGDAHLHECLRALATFQPEPKSAP